MANWFLLSYNEKEAKFWMINRRVEIEKYNGMRHAAKEL